jgi:hypothetical protein
MPRISIDVFDKILDQHISLEKVLELINEVDVDSIKVEATA